MTEKPPASPPEQHPAEPELTDDQLSQVSGGNPITNFRPY
jgi:bacteriocin-like protein